MEETCLLVVRVTPNSSRNQLVVSPDLSCKAFVACPPADGEANTATIQLLSKALHNPASKFEFVSGQRSRTKTVKITGISCRQCEERLRQFLNAQDL